VTGWDVSGLSPNRPRFLTQSGTRNSNQALRPISAEGRCPILLAFLHRADEEISDEVVDLFDRCLTGAYARAGGDLYVGDQRLYRPDRIGKYEHAEQLLKCAINTKLILGRRDDLMRVAGSLTLGRVTSSLLGGRYGSAEG
jgi:hypothetical protein